MGLTKLRSIAVAVNDIFFCYNKINFIEDILFILIKSATIYLLIIEIFYFV